MSYIFEIAARAMYQAVKPARNSDYRRFVKRFPCVGCGRTWWIDPAHTGAHGLSQKASDFSCLPLCRLCHEEFDKHPREFARVHNLDIEGLIEMFNGWYADRERKKAA